MPVGDHDGYCHGGQNTASIRCSAGAVFIFIICGLLFPLRVRLLNHKHTQLCKMHTPVCTQLCMFAPLHRWRVSLGADADDTAAWRGSHMSIETC